MTKKQSKIHFIGKYQLFLVRYLFRHITPSTFYKKRSYEERPIKFGFIRNGDPLNFSTIRNETIKKPPFFQKNKKLNLHEERVLHYVRINKFVNKFLYC